MAALGIVIIGAALSIIVLAVIGAIFSKSTPEPEPEPAPVYVKCGAVRYRRIVKR